MKLITRNYLNTLIDIIGTPDIKIITGVRRSGKSKLLEAFKEYITNNVKEVNIIYINYNLIEFENLKEYHEQTNASMLIITHQQSIIDLLKPDYVHILKDGKIEANTLINSYKSNGATCKEID